MRNLLLLAVVWAAVGCTSPKVKLPTWESNTVAEHPVVWQIKNKEATSKARVKSLWQRGPTEDYRNPLPSKQLITTAEEFAEIWWALGFKEEVPEINFKKRFVVWWALNPNNPIQDDIRIEIDNGHAHIVQPARAMMKWKHSNERLILVYEVVRHSKMDSPEGPVE